MECKCCLKSYALSGAATIMVIGWWSHFVNIQHADFFFLFILLFSNAPFIKEDHFLGDFSSYPLTINIPSTSIAHFLLFPIKRDVTWFCIRFFFFFFFLCFFNLEARGVTLWHFVTVDEIPVYQRNFMRTLIKR